MHSESHSQPTHLDRNSRVALLDGPSPVLVVYHTGCVFDYSHQCTVAEGAVSADRSRQFLEQADSNKRPFLIEFPARALAAASPSFKQSYESSSNTSRIRFDLGNLLPGYAMCVLDWYGRSLASRQWYSFLPEEPSMQIGNEWFWVYCYATMRRLGLDEFASSLGEVIGGMMGRLAIDAAGYEHLLRAVPVEDPLIVALATHTAQSMVSQTLALTEADIVMITERFPSFAELVNSILRRR
ncbi:hypothetical protein FB567DRAFT_562125 [Paraphoma chrysanthemicola]|uniref:Uncharacterized protein n=1 Tax=Paraphoma chrysanthemicola TaxID=798071 RepID=A0A8K0R2U1_9PLEO|nr:hypothetical protein FB567DRAFT_562125 [Paraphoma chrysanthemicola]